jgi:hypothetical protein
VIKDLARWPQQIAVELLPFDAAIAFIGLRVLSARAEVVASAATTPSVKLGPIVQEIEALRGEAEKEIERFLEDAGDLALARPHD